LQLYQHSVTANPSETIASVACTWMKRNKPIWKTWKSGSESEKTVLYIGGIFPISGTYTEQGIVIAANMATRAVNANDTVLKDYILRVHSFDGQCRADMVMKSFIDYIRLSTFPHMAGILGRFLMKSFTGTATSRLFVSSVYHLLILFSGTLIRSSLLGYCRTTCGRCEAL